MAIIEYPMGWWQTPEGEVEGKIFYDDSVNGWPVISVFYRNPTKDEASINIRLSNGNWMPPLIFPARTSPQGLTRNIPKNEQPFFENVQASMAFPAINPVTRRR